MPPPSHMGRKRSIDASHAAPSLRINEVILLLLSAVSGTLLCISRIQGDVLVGGALWKDTKSQQRI